MRLLIEVDCLYVPLALAFHWFFFCKIHTHEASQWGGLPRCTLGTGISLKICFDKIHSWGFSLRWTALMCHWHWHFTENLFWQNNSFAKQLLWIKKICWAHYFPIKKFFREQTVNTRYSSPCPCTSVSFRLWSRPGVSPSVSSKKHITLCVLL